MRLPGTPQLRAGVLPQVERQYASQGAYAGPLDSPAGVRCAAARMTRGHDLYLTLITWYLIFSTSQLVPRTWY